MILNYNIMENTLFEVEKITYWQRIVLSLKKNLRLLKFVGILLITIPSTIHINFPFGTMVALIFFVLLFFMPILFQECKIYIFSIKQINNDIEIRYQLFNADKVLNVKAEQLRLVELNKGTFSLTVSKVSFYIKLNRTDVNYLIDQYRIIKWSDDELLDKLVKEFRGK